MNLDDDDDLHLDAWRVPPPRPVDRSTLYARVLSPAAPPARPRTRWIFAALAIANVVLAAIIVIVVSKRPTTQTIVRVQPAGNGGADIDAALRRLEDGQRALEAKVAELTERVRQCEQSSYKTTPRPRPVTPPPSPSDQATPPATPPTSASSRALPDMLDRENITAAVASIRSLITSCGQQYASAKGTVKVRVRVSPNGRVEEVLVANTPDAGLGGCVASAVRKAIFEPTFHGGAFTYPFVFGATP